MLKYVKQTLLLLAVVVAGGVCAENLYDVEKILRVLSKISHRAYVTDRNTMKGWIDEIENQKGRRSIIIEPRVEAKIKECKALLNGSLFTDNKIDFIAKVNAIINEINQLQVSSGANYQTEIRSHYGDIEEYGRTHTSL